VAKAAAAEGADVLLAYNIGPFRMDGLGSLIGYLPYGDANAITFGMARAIVPAAGEVPVVAGIGAADPYRSQRLLVEQALALGYVGITNTPTAGVYSGDFRAGIEAAGLGYGREIELFALCNALDVFTVAYAFDEDQARSVADAGADVIIAHLGLTASSADAIARQNALDRACEATERMVDAVRTIRADAIVGVHGGPLESSDAVGYVLSRTHAQAYVGGSAVERMPVERAVRAATAEFRALKLAS
jgi:predicted TIM-barrel enzyme